MLINGRYLHGRKWASAYRGRSGLAEYPLAPGVVAVLYDSDPMYLAVFFVNGEPVAGESCVVNPDEWVAKTAADAEFLNTLRNL